MPIWRWCSIAWAVVLLGLLPTTYAAQTALAVGAQTHSALASHAGYWIDESGEASLEQAMAQAFEPVAAHYVNRGLDQRVHWYRMDLKVSESGTGPWILRAGLPHQFTQAWLMLEGAEPLELQADQAGALFPLDLPAGHIRLYLRSQTTGWHMQRLELVRPEHHWKSRFSDALPSAIYYGAIGALLLLALLIGIWLREAVYLYFAFTQVALAGYQLVAVDFWAAALVQSPREQSLIAYVAALLISIAFTQYARSSMGLAVQLPRLDRGLRVLLWLYGLVLLILPWLPLEAMLWLVAPLGILTPLSLLLTGTVSVIRQLPSARFFLAGWGVYQIGMVIYTLGVSNVEPFAVHPDTQALIFKLTFVVEAILLVLGLAERYRLIRQSLVERQREVIALREQQAERLEAMVEQRTEELEEINVELARSDATKDRLMSVIGHDLRAGVASLRLSLPDQGTEATPTNTAHLSPDRVDSMRDVVVGLEETLFNLLRWAQAQRHGLTPTSLPVQPAELLAQLQHEQEGQFAVARVRLKVLASSALVISSDPDMLAVILRNLISNALRFTQPGGEVIVSAETIQGGLEIVVTDTGIGMSEAQRDALFAGPANPRADSVGRRGAGIGLLLVRDFADALGYTLEVDSTPGKGSQVRLRIPVDTSSDETEITGTADTTGS